MFTTSRILAFSLLATRASALPANITERAPELGDVSEDEALSQVERATLAPVYKKCKTPGTVAITFDECIYTTENEKRLKAAYAAGHQIASHTWEVFPLRVDDGRTFTGDSSYSRAHLDWLTPSKDELKSEMTRIDTALEKILDVKPVFRPPSEVAAANGQALVIWDFDSGDSVGATVQQSETAYTNIANKKPSTILTLNHESFETTAHQVLPFASKTLQAKGYAFVTVAECLGNKNPYLTKTIPGKRDSTWKC